MDHETYRHLVTDEAVARAYFLSRCGSGERMVCPRCHRKKHYLLASGKRRCAKCKYTFHEFTGKWINRGRLSFVQWLKVLQAFTREHSVETASKSSAMAYNTAYHCFQTIRYAICSSTDDGLNYLLHYTTIDEPYFNPRQRKPEHQNSAKPIFGIRLSGENVQVTFLPNMNLALIDQMDLRFGRIGPFKITGQMGYFNHLIFYAPTADETWLDAATSLNRRVGFEWHWAEARLVSHRGLSPQKLPLYLKELEFRYNRLKGDLFDDLSGALCVWDVSKNRLSN